MLMWFDYFILGHTFFLLFTLLLTLVETGSQIKNNRL